MEEGVLKGPEVCLTSSRDALPDTSGCSQTRSQTRLSATDSAFFRPGPAVCTYCAMSTSCWQRCAASWRPQLGIAATVEYLAAQC